MLPIYAATTHHVRHPRRSHEGDKVHLPYCRKKKSFLVNHVPDAVFERIPPELFHVRLAQLNAVVLKHAPHPVLRYIMYMIPFLMVAPILVFAHSSFGTVSSIISVLLLVSMFVPIVLCPLYINKAHWQCHEELTSTFDDFTRIDALPPRCLQWHMAHPTGLEHRTSMFPGPLDLTIEISFPATQTIIVTTETTTVEELCPLAPPPYSLPIETKPCPSSPALVAVVKDELLTSLSKPKEEEEGQEEEQEGVGRGKAPVATSSSSSALPISNPVMDSGTDLDGSSLSCSSFPDERKMNKINPTFIATN